MILETLESPNPGKPVKSSLTGSLVFFLTSGDRINIKVLTISCYKHWRVVVSFFKIRNYLFDDVREHGLEECIQLVWQRLAIKTYV